MPREAGRALKYTLGPGEHELLKEVVVATRDRKRVPSSRLIVTDRRLVLLVPKPDKWSKLVGGLFGRAASKLAEDLDLAHQIKRGEFSDVEERDPGMLVFHSKGEGYAHVSFEVFDASPLALWQQRMRDWVDGKDEAVAKSAGG